MIRTQDTRIPRYFSTISVDRFSSTLYSELLAHTLVESFRKRFGESVCQALTMSCSRCQSP